MLTASIAVEPLGNLLQRREVATLRIGNLRAGNGRGVFVYLATATEDEELQGPAAFSHIRSEGALACIVRALGALRDARACEWGAAEAAKLSPGARRNLGLPELGGER